MAEYIEKKEQLKKLETQIANIEKEVDIIPKNTVISYGKDWIDFQRWCEYMGLERLPASYDTITKYLLDLQLNKKLKINTLKRRLSTIAVMHRRANHNFDRKNEVLENCVKLLKKREKNIPQKAPPLLLDDLKKIIDQINKDIYLEKSKLIHYRDKALICLAWFGAFRRSEVAEMEIRNITIHENQGLEIFLDKSKTDQEGKKIPRALNKSNDPKSNYCPMKNYKEWIDISGISEGKVFRQINKSNSINYENLSDKSVSEILKYRAIKANVNINKLSGHSFRSGLVTELLKSGATESEIMEITQHSSIEMVREYKREVNLFDTAVKRLKIDY